MDSESLAMANVTKFEMTAMRVRKQLPLVKTKVKHLVAHATMIKGVIKKTPALINGRKTFNQVLKDATQINKEIETIVGEARWVVSNAPKGKKKEIGDAGYGDVRALLNQVQSETAKLDGALKALHKELVTAEKSTIPATPTPDAGTYLELLAAIIKYLKKKS